MSPDRIPADLRRRRTYAPKLTFAAGTVGIDLEAPGGEEAEEITVKNGTGAAIRQGFLRLGGKVLSTWELPAGA